MIPCRLPGLHAFSTAGILCNKLEQGLLKYVVPGEEFRSHMLRALVAYLNTKEACSANRSKEFQNLSATTWFSESAGNCKPVKSSYWGMCRVWRIEIEGRVAMSGNFTLDSGWELGGWIRDEQMKLACISLGRLDKMFSRGLRIIWSRFQSIAADECKSSLFLWSRWLLILVMLKIKHLNGNSTYGAEWSQTTLLLAVFQWLHGKIVMHSEGHRLNICLYEHKWAPILSSLYLFNTSSSMFIHSFNKICLKFSVCPCRWYNSKQVHSWVDFVVCCGRGGYALDIHWTPTIGGWGRNDIMNYSGFKFCPHIAWMWHES